MKSLFLKVRVKIIFVLFLLIPNYGFCTFGLAETSFPTPGGHNICDCDPYESDQTPILVNFEQLEKLEKWYFYKNNIIGKGAGYFFIFNESNEKVQYFKNEKLWKNAIETQNLKPFIFTRWLSLRDSPDEFLFGIVLLVILFSPFILISAIILWILTYKKIIIWSKRKINIIRVMIILLLLFILSNDWLISF